MLELEVVKQQKLSVPNKLFLNVGGQVSVAWY